MADAFQYDVFLSHSTKDKAVVRPLAERLRKDGLKVWFDEWVLKAGDSIPAKIEEGLEHSRVLVLCMSANAFGSDWAQLESGTFRFRDPLNKERRFIPLRLDDAPIKGSLAQFPYVNWFPTDREQEYAKLLESCQLRTSSKIHPSVGRVGEEMTEQKEFNALYVMEDLLHQLRTPVLQAELRAKRALELPAGSRDEKELFAIRGLCAKAGRILRQGNLLAQLHAGRQVTIRTSPITRDGLTRLAIEIAQDAEILSSHRKIRCVVERHSFVILDSILVSSDLELIRVALSNLVDNAFKYSYEHTTVVIDVGLTRSNRFRVTVSNVGIPISREEVAKCVTRGWRSPTALAVTGEGSGIGLWVTDNIMRVLGGELIVNPTQNGTTDVSLIFPTIGKHS